MNKADKKLASRLLYLSIDLGEKIFLWLTYRGLKPVSEITIIRRNLHLLRLGIKTPFDLHGPQAKRIHQWINDANLYRHADPRYPESWHIGKNKNQVELSTKTIRIFNYESEIKTGLLFGYPKDSVEAYAKNQNDKVQKPDVKNISMIWPGDFPKHPLFKNKYYLPYMFYAIDSGHVKKDVEVAKNWANTIRKELPLLAKWYEKYKLKQLRHDAKTTNNWQ